VILHYLAKIRVFKENYRNSLTIVKDVIPTYVSDLVEVNKARKFIDNVDHGSINARDEYYSKAEPFYKQLDEIASRFSQAEPLIQERVEEDHRKKREEDRKERQDLRRFLIQLAVSVTVGIFTIAGVAVGIYSAFK
jgi:iron uptake system EfeUOB component EfeO/EfeM